MKKILCFILLLLPAIPALSQITRKGVMTENFRRIDRGDTIDVVAAQMRYGYILYIIKNEERTVEAPSEKFKYIDEELDFWEDLWFKYKSIDVYTNTQKVPNKYQKEKSLDIVLSLQEENKLYNDPFIEDYLLQKILRIQPNHDLFGKDSNRFNIKLLNHPTDEIAVLPNKTILISVDWLAKTSTDEELHLALNKALLYAFFGYHLKSYKTPPSMYETEEEQEVPLDDAEKQRTQIYAAQLFRLQNEKNAFEDKKLYLNNISNVVTYVGWQEYYNQHYKQALKLINKIIENGLATDEEYFLKTRLYRKMYNSPEKNKEALTFIEKANTINTYRFPELMEEHGLLLIRLKRFDEAKQVFEEYLEVLKSTPADAQKIKWCRAMISKCDTSAGLMNL